MSQIALLLLAAGTALLTLGNPFFLVLSATGLAYRRCELMWMKEGRAGVRFIEPSEKRPAGSAAKDKQPA